MVWRRKRAAAERKADPDIRDTGYTEVWGEHVHAARYYRSLTLFLGFIILLLGFSFGIVVTRPDPLPVIVRVNEVGRAQVVDYNADRAEATPDDPVIPYFLTAFVHDHFSRQRVIGTEDWRRSLFFMRSDLATAAYNRDREGFIAFLGDPSAPEQVVENVQIRLVPQPEPPYAAEIVFDRVGRLQGAEVSRLSMIVSLRFLFAEEIEGEALIVNPMGIVIVFFDQQVTLGG